MSIAPSVFVLASDAICSCQRAPARLFVRLLDCCLPFPVKRIELAKDIVKGQLSSLFKEVDLKQ